MFNFKIYNLLHYQHFPSLVHTPQIIYLFSLTQIFKTISKQYNIYQVLHSLTEKKTVSNRCFIHKLRLEQVKHYKRCLAVTDILKSYSVKHFEICLPRILFIESYIVCSVSLLCGKCTSSTKLNRSNSIKGLKKN